MAYQLTQTFSPKRSGIFEQFTAATTTKIDNYAEELYFRSLTLFNAIKKNKVLYIARRLCYSKEFLNEVVCGRTFLIEAVQQNREKIVKLFLFYEANPNKPDKFDKTPLHYAVINGNIKISKILLKYGANPVLKDKYGNMPAAYLPLEIPELAHFLIMFLNSINTGLQSPLKDGELELKEIIINTSLLTGCLAPLQMLKASFNINTASKDGNPAVFMALECEDRSKRNQLLDYLQLQGADFNKKNKNGDTLLHVVCEKNILAVAEDLVTTYKVDLNAENHNKDTAVHICLRNSEAKIMETIFIQMRGEKIFQQTNLQGNTILHEAILHQNPIGTNIILHKLKCSLSNFEIDFLKQKNLNSETALHIACQKNEKKIVTSLLELFIKEIRSFDNKQLRHELNEIHNIIYSFYVLGQTEYLHIFIQTIIKYNLDCYLLFEMLSQCNILELYLTNGLSLNKTDDHGHDILHYAIEFDNLQGIECILNHVSMHTINIEYRSEAVYQAVKKKNNQVVKLLMETNNITSKLVHTYFKDSALKALELQAYSILDIIIKNDIEILLSFEPNQLMVFDYITSKSNSTKEEVTLSFDKALKHYETKTSNLSKTLGNLCFQAYDDKKTWLTTYLIQYNNTNRHFILHEAVLRHRLDYLEYLIDNEIDINGKNKRGDTALHIAIQRKELKKIILLLEKGADINCTNNKGKTCFHYAIEKGLAHKLLPFVLQETYSQQCCRILNGGRNHLSISSVLKESVDLNVQDVRGNTCLHVAIVQQDDAISKLLVRSGAQVFLMNAIQETPLHIAIQRKEFEILDIMFQQLQSAVLKDTFTRLFLSILTKSKDSSKTAMSYLLEMISNAQIDFNAPDKEGELALNTAVKYEQIDMIELLLQHNAQPNISDRASMNAIDYAVKNRNRSILIILLLANKENSVNSQGNTLFHLAVEYDDMNLLTDLVGQNDIINTIAQCDINQLNKQEKTALSIAVDQQNLKALWILLENKADMSIKNSVGESIINLTALSYNVIRKIYVDLYTEDVIGIDLLKDHECPVCLDIPQMVMSCSRGHVICSRCKDRLECPICPICRITLSLGCSRSLKHEQEIKREMIKVIQNTY